MREGKRENWDVYVSVCMCVCERERDLKSGRDESEEAADHLSRVHHLRHLPCRACVRACGCGCERECVCECVCVCVCCAGESRRRLRQLPCVCVCVWMSASGLSVHRLAASPAPRVFHLCLFDCVHFLSFCSSVCLCVCVCVCVCVRSGQTMDADGGSE